MPDPHSVNNITKILSGIIKEELRQKISVTGKVSVDKHPRVFWLTDGTNKIRCFIPGGNRAQFGSLLEVENTVIVNGKIELFPSESEYQLRVAAVLPIAKAPKINQQSVSGITANLSNLIQKSVGLQGIQVHGDISNFDSKSKHAFWFLSDTNIANLQRIHCVFFDADGIAAGNGDQVRVDGNIQIFGAQSRYQINIAEVQLEGCKCPGCGSCKKIAAAPQCSTLPDPKYELCSACYANSPDHEKRVEEAVETYFSDLKVKGFSPKTQHGIQIGSENRIADVVLTNENRSFVSIAECKGAGFVGDGREQLYSYLSATDTRFGVFANRADPKDWEFYENRRRNRFDKIDRSKFEVGVVEGPDTRERLKDEIRGLNGEITGLENQKSELIAAVEQITQTEHNLNERTSDLTQQIETLESYKSGLHEEIHRKLDNLLEEKMQRLEKPLSDLRCELDTAVNQITQKQIEALESYKSGLHEEIHRKLDNLLEEKMQRLEKPLSDLKIELQKRGIKNWFKNLFSKENE